MRTRLQAGPLLSWLLLLVPVTGTADSRTAAESINGGLLCYLKGAAAVAHLQDAGATSSGAMANHDERLNAIARIEASEDCLRSFAESVPVASQQDFEAKRVLTQVLEDLHTQKEAAARGFETDFDSTLIHSLRLRERALHRWLVSHHHIDAEYRTVYAQLAALISQRSQVSFMQAMSQGRAVDPHLTNRKVEHWLTLVNRELSTVAALDHAELDHAVGANAEIETVELLADLAALERHAWQVLAALSNDDFRDEKLMALRSLRRQIQDVHIRLTELMGAEAVPVTIGG